MPVDAASGNPPALLIRLPLEGPPVVYSDCLHESDAVRLRDWFDNHEELADLVDDAVRIRTEWIRREQAA